MATQTTHFNINKPEGTDIFAPLTFDNDAYDLIDSVMYNNQNRGITTTSISYSAGVFAIARNVPTCNFLVFTAPADFTAGNTVEVDGDIKTVRFMDGTSLQTGAWKINYSVLAYVDGAILNIVSSTTGDYATLIGDLTDLDTTDKSSVVNAINELVSVDTGKQDSYDATLTTTDKTIVGAINELKLDTDTLTSESFNVYGLTIKVNKRDGIVLINITGTLSVAFNNPNVYTTFVTLSSNFLPNASMGAVYVKCVTKNAYFRVRTNGELQLYNMEAVGVGDNVDCSLVYLA